MKELPFSVEQAVVIRARRATVFRFFTDSARFASWWGPGSSIDPRPGGDVTIRYPGGVTARGNVLEVVDGERIVFTYGYEDASKPIAPGGSRVTVLFRDVSGGTEVTLRHEVADAGARDAHGPGWRFQLSLFANVAAAEEHAGAGDRVAGWFEAWRSANPAERLALLEQHACPDVSFRDRFACIIGREELAGHIHASHVHMPGLALEQRGGLRSCQGTVVAEWVAKGPNDATVATGLNVFELAPDGRIASVVGFGD